MKLLSYYKTAFNKSDCLINWREHDICEQMIYSHRRTEFNAATFPSYLHFHDYYELVIFIEGDVRYICESNSCLPKYGDIIIIPPGKLHMSMINAESTRYTRYVFYLFPDVFDAINARSLLDFMLKDESSEHFMFSLKPTHVEELLTLLGHLDNSLARETSEDHALAFAYTLQIFYLLNQPADLSIRSDPYFPQNVLEIQRYLDEHFTEISSVAEVAAHFFYSREYVSRLFKRYLKTTVAEYILKRRVSYSQKLMGSDLSLIDVCFRSGFGSVSAFIRAFQHVTGVSPSKYRRMYYAKE